jgi:hypothetical protein
MSKIYLKTDQKFKNHIELLRYFYRDRQADVTYKNKECTKIQCEPDRLRSFDDLYYLCKTYFPTITYKTVFKTLLRLYYSSNSYEYTYQLANCLAMRRIRYYIVVTLSKNCAEGVLRRAINQSIYYYDQPKLGSLYSWEELFSMLGLNSRNEIVEYLVKDYKNRIKIN